MAVTGPNVPSNTTIASISGTTITLSISYNAFTRGSSVTRLATVKKPDFDNPDEYWLITNTGGIQVNDLAGNSAGITLDLPHGTNIRAGTKVKSKVTNVSVTINKKSQFDEDSQFTAIFWTPVTFSSATYTFTASNVYTIRADENLPFGSFPGVGGFYG
jgi:hypothetical protein